MPLSKQKNKERMAEVRLHTRKNQAIVQPQKIKRPQLDADGRPIPEYD